MTLHLLDSAPLTDTLDTFLKQRSRAIHTHLAPITGVENKVSDGSQKQPVREVTNRLQRLLEVIAHTVDTARDVFLVKGDNSPSMVTRVLRAIQTDAEASITTDLCPTTQSLLSSMPSSTYFLLLPADIKQYRPYIDLSSTTSLVKPDALDRMVAAWFTRATEKLQAALNSIFSALASVKDAWTVYNCVTRWINAAGGLLEKERQTLTRLVEDACNSRIKELWVASLDALKSKFRAGLASLATQVQEDAPDCQLGEPQPNLKSVKSHFNPHRFGPLQVYPFCPSYTIRIPSRCYRIVHVRGLFTL